MACVVEVGAFFGGKRFGCEGRESRMETGEKGGGETTMEDTVEEGVLSVGIAEGGRSLEEARVGGRGGWI
jgi:hypothetical protein